MQYKSATDKTIGGIKNAIESGMYHNENKRKQVFVCAINKEGIVIVHPQSESDNYSSDYRGYQGVQKYNWKNVPNYADNLAKKLYEITNK